MSLHVTNYRNSELSWTAIGLSKGSAIRLNVVLIVRDVMWQGASIVGSTSANLTHFTPAGTIKDILLELKKARTH